MHRRTIAPLVLLALSLVSFGERAHAREDEVTPAKVERHVDIAKAAEKDFAERVVAEITDGSLELVVDPTIDAPTVDVEFTVDGADDKDVKRRAEVVRLFAERSSDQSVVVQVVYPGKTMPRDSAKVKITVPKCGDSSLRSTKGAITAIKTAGKLRVKSKEGAIKIDRNDGSVDVNGGKGAIDVLGANAEVRLSGGAGKVTVTLADANDLPFDVEAKGGAIRMEVGAAFDGVVKMHTTSGEIEFSDGSKSARVPTSTEHSKTVEIGAAGGHSEIRTTTGAIELVVRSK